MKQLSVAIEVNGIHFYTEITVSEDHTMNEVVNAIKERANADHCRFRLVETMKGYAQI